MITVMKGWRAKAAIAAALVLASMSSASAQRHDQAIGPRNFALSYQDAMSWAAAQPSSVRGHRRARRALGSVPSVGVTRGDVGNADTNYWYERNRQELRGRW